MEPVEEHGIDLALERFGGYVLAANDEFFASRENLILEHEAIWDPEAFVPTGKWMDGWETRRRRQKGYDWAIIRLGLPGTINKIDVDTSHFKGNYPPEASVEGCVAAPNARVADLTDWVEIVPRSPLQGDSSNFFEVESPFRFTHVRVNIYPDGGVARLRVYGNPIPEWFKPSSYRQTRDMANLASGGHVTTCSDMFFGNRQNLIAPGPSLRMDQGWETKRRRDDGHDWAIVKLPVESRVISATVDSTLFKGNCPDRCLIEVSAESDFEEVSWSPATEEIALIPHTVLPVTEGWNYGNPVRWAKFSIYPDGGMARLRLWGEPTEQGWQEARLIWLNSLTLQALEQALVTCCASTTWAQKTAAQAPYESLDDLKRKADQAWDSVTESDRLEAFEAHPRIGAKVTQESQHHKWSADEQSGVSDEDALVRDRLNKLNQEYFDKFGFVFLICATGLSGASMLTALESRLNNDRAEELKNAGEEQAKITAIRLEKLVTL